MSDFRWNQPNLKSFWDHQNDKEVDTVMTDKDLINNPGFIKIEELMRAICRVTHELIELEEKRVQTKEKA